MSNVVGVGIDLVSVKSFKEQIGIHDEVFIKHTFTEQEIEDAKEANDELIFYAGRFAVKEAVFKAVGHLMPEKAFDFRRVECKRDEDGRPVFVRNDYMNTVLEKANVNDVLISISNEEEYVVAIAEAVR